MMEDFLYYLLKVSMANAILVMGWFILFRRDNILNFNRAYFLSSIILPWIFPLITYRLNFLQSARISESLVSFNDGVTEVASSVPFADPGLVFTDLAMLVYLAITLIFLLRMFTGLLQVLKIIKESKKDDSSGYSIYCSRSDILPFSFFNRFIIGEKYVSLSGLDFIIAHERAHSEMWHSIDVILFALFRSVMWFNPCAWYLENLAKANLEYIADREVISSNPANTGYYQKLLVSLGTGSNTIEIVNNFNHNQLIKRIAMMKNAIKTKKPGAKYLLIFPLLALLSMTFCTKEISERITPYYYIDGVLSDADDLNYLNPDKIETIKVISDPAGTEYENPENMKVVIVTTKESSGGEEQEAGENDFGEKEAGTGIKIRMNEVENLPAEKSIEVTGYMQDDSTGITIPHTDSVDIRPGFRSIPGPQPIIYLDGKLYEGKLETIDPSKIERIEVVKGEEAVTRTGNEFAKLAGAIFISIGN